MEVFFLCNSLAWNTTGGAERQLLLAARELANLGVRSRMRAFVSDVVGDSLRPQMADLLRAGGDFGKFSLGELMGLRREENVYWSWGRRADTVLKFLKPVLKGRLFCSIRDADEANMERFRHVERLFHSRVERYVTNSRRAASQLARHVPNLQPRTWILLNALLRFPEPAEPPEAGPEFRVGMLANLLVHKKGYDIALEAGERIKAAGSRIVIRIAGHDHTAGAYPAEIRRRGLESVVRFEGVTTRPLEFLSSNHAFLMLSRYEGCPNALMEAMSLGLPSVSTRVGDVAELFEGGRHLLLLDVPDATQAFSALERLRSDYEAARRMGSHGRSRCRELFSRERLRTDLARLFGVPFSKVPEPAAVA